MQTKDAEPERFKSVSNEATMRQLTLISAFCQCIVSRSLFNLNFLNMKVTFKKAFSIIDGRLSTKIDDVYEMLNFIFNGKLSTHQLPSAMYKLTSINPKWYNDARMKLQYIKESNATNDFNDLMSIIDAFFSDYEIEIFPISKEELDFFNDAHKGCG